jgi:hypothetical protein
VAADRQVPIWCAPAAVWEAGSSPSPTRLALFGAFRARGVERFAELVNRAPE